MKTMALSALILVGVICSPSMGQDALDEALKLVGMKRADLGWTPRMWWPRWPDVPYKFRAFDGLFAAPLETISYARVLADLADKKLDPKELDKDQGRGSTALFQAMQSLGMDPKFGGLRGYTANCLAEPLPLDEAVLALIRADGHPTKINTFGMDLHYPRPKKDLQEKVKVLPEGVSPILGQLVLNLIDARKWMDLAFRRSDPKAVARAAKRVDVGEEMIDAYDYIPELDDLAQTYDEASLWNAGQKCVQALDQARIALKKLDLKEVQSFAFDWPSPWGWIRVRGGGDDVVDGHGSLLIVDLGGNDTYSGPVAASSADLPISLLLDLKGDDAYQSDEPAQGAGLCGIGVLIDGQGDDRYQARHYAQGVGQFGLGLLADLSGKDSYFTKYSGQGCGYFGIGLLFDASGDDQYKIYADGQGLGGVVGVGVLADHSGNDSYLAVRPHTITGRPSYHSPKNDVCVSNAQGCGMGRRGDGADGHSWAGGLGLLLDSSGDDKYVSGNWAMGVGYWFGVGILHDKNGDDEYHGVAYTQGAGAHFCIGALIDEKGDDKHLAEENSNQSISWAHDFTISIHLDGEGNDLYSIDDNGLACSINRSVALLFDLSGKDIYQTKKIKHPGYTKTDPKFRARGGVSTYFSETTSLGLFLDLDGEDQYWEGLTNNKVWLDPEDSPNWEDRNFSVGLDLTGGKIDFTLEPIKKPSNSK